MRLKATRPLSLSVYAAMVLGFGTVGFLIVVWVLSLVLAESVDVKGVGVEPSVAEAAEAQLEKLEPVEFDLD